MNLRHGLPSFERWLALLALAGCAGAAAPEPSRVSVPPPASVPTVRDCSVYDTDPHYLQWDARDRHTSQVECELNNELGAFLDGLDACSTTSDCAVVWTTCPFGCGLPISREHVEEVSREYDELRERFKHATGAVCHYKCNLVTAARCAAGHCVDADSAPK